MDPGPGLIHGLRLAARTASGIAIARLSGELAIASSPALRDELLGLLRRGSSRLVLDLSAVTSCDASGLAVLVGVLAGGLAVAPPMPGSKSTCRARVGSDSIRRQAC